MADLALIGAGYWGKNLARNFHTLGVLHTICDPSELTLSKYGAEYSDVRKCCKVDEAFSNQAINKVVIAAPATQHYSLAKRALESGKDVFVEKPLCLDIAEAQELIQLAKQNGRILMVGHLLQYHPCIQKLQELVSSGALGKLQYITSNRLNLGKIRHEENALWSFAPHDISVILSLAGNQLPDQVRCTGEAYLNDGVADTTLTSLRFPGKIHAHIYVSWLNPFKEQKLTVVGSRGMAVFDDTKPWKEKLLIYHDYLTWTDGNVPTPSKATAEDISIVQTEPLLNECGHFIECCANRSTPRTNGEEGLRVLQVLQAAQSSLDTQGEAQNPKRVKPLSVPDYFAHETAVIDEGAQIGRGTKIWHFSHIMPGAVLGENCNLGQNVVVSPGVTLGRNVKVQNNVSIYSGVTIEDHVFLGPSCVLTNITNPRSEINRKALYKKTLIKKGATIGANATIVCGVTLGRYCFIAAGAVVTKNVPDYAVMVGVPARQKSWMSRHGHPLHQESDGVFRCPESGFCYKEVEQGVLSCLDLFEDDNLPSDPKAGRSSPESFQGSK